MKHFERSVLWHIRFAELRKTINPTTTFNRMNLSFDSQVRDIWKILWKRGEIAPKEQFLLFSTIFCCLLADLCVQTGTRFSLRDKRLFEISEFEITRVDCISIFWWSPRAEILKPWIQFNCYLPLLLGQAGISKQCRCRLDTTEYAADQGLQCLSLIQHSLLYAYTGSQNVRTSMARS